MSPMRSEPSKTRIVGTYCRSGIELADRGVADPYAFTKRVDDVLFFVLLGPHECVFDKIFLNLVEQVLNQFSRFTGPLRLLAWMCD